MTPTMNPVFFKIWGHTYIFHYWKNIALWGQNPFLKNE
jgi:hypothetical protein